MKNITCMVTGHRNIEIGKLDYVKSNLRYEIMLALDEGYTHFMSGFAEGADLIFADIIAELKETHHIKLEAAIPCRSRMKTPNKDFQRLMLQCDTVNVYSEKYFASCFMDRNRFMVNKSDRIIAVYDGRKKGGTFNTIRYAHTLGKEVVVISV